MDYNHGLMSQIEQWLEAGVIPFPRVGERIVELGDQALNAGPRYLITANPFCDVRRPAINTVQAV